MKVWVVFPTLNRYQHARIAAARAAGLDVGVVEISRLGSYPIPGWRAPQADHMPDVVSLFDDRLAWDVPTPLLHQRLVAQLDAKRAQVDVIAVLGWGNREAISTLSWANANRVPVIAFSDSHDLHKKRSLLKELPKHRLVGLFSSALIAGRPHRDYIAKLGMQHTVIFDGYNAVDNEHFAASVGECKKQRVEKSCGEEATNPFFLVSARFIEEKNLPRLLHAYALYRRRAQEPNADTQSVGHQTPSPGPWHLVLVGDGPLRPKIEKLLAELDLNEVVHLDGYQQFDKLPHYYSGASALVLPSISETWGLVVNEAMASGLPVLVSNHCGCAPDLVQDGVNGFTFDPYDVEGLAQLMVRVSGMDERERGKMGDESRRIIADWGLERFAAGLKAAVDKAVEVGPIKPSMVQCLLLAALVRR